MQTTVLHRKMPNDTLHFLVGLQKKEDSAHAKSSLSPLKAFNIIKSLSLYQVSKSHPHTPGWFYLM